MDGKTFRRGLLHVFFPTRCVCCNRVIPPSLEVCEACRAELPRVPAGCCPACGKPTGRCRCRRTDFVTLSPFFYTGGIQQGLLTLKRGYTHAVPFFAHEMAALVTERLGHGFDEVAAVPVSKAGLRRRGYNQSELLAAALAKELGLPFCKGALRRLFETPDQHSLPKARRRGNVFGVFEANPAIVGGKALLLVDDIMTTGATLQECGRALLLAGCREVAGVTAASTPQTNKRLGEANPPPGDA